MECSRIFFLSIINPASCLHHLFPPPRSSAASLRSYEIYEDRTPVQSDIVAFLTTRKEVPTVNVHTSVSFNTRWRIQLLTVIIVIPITIILLGPLPYNFSSFLSHSINSNLNVTVCSFIVLSSTYSIMFCDRFCFLLFSLCCFIFNYFCCKYVIKRSVLPDP